MPNWCSNRLEVLGTKREVENFMEFAEGPSSVSWAGADSVVTNYVARETLLSLPKLVPPGEITVALQYMEPTQATYSGYHWQIDNWGTKWGVECSDAVAGGFAEGNEFEYAVVYSFDSAWSPIEAAVHSFAPKWPELSFRLTYMEEGCDFTGELYYEKGSLITDCAHSIKDQDVMEFYGYSTQEEVDEHMGRNQPDLG